MGLEAYIVTENISIYEAIKFVNKNGQGIVFICKNEQLLGVMSDGDFRRYMLNGGDMQSTISHAMNSNPYFVYARDSVDVFAYMAERRITALPIINSEHMIVEIVFANGRRVYRKKPLETPVVIMAGGKGTRLSPYTNILPKPLIPIGNKTITEYIIEQFTNFGCTDFYMIVNYHKNLIKTFFQENEIQRNIVFVEEEQYLGTGGGLKLVKNCIKGTFFLSNCDILVNDSLDYMLEFHKEKNNLITMICANKKVAIPYGTVTVSPENEAISLTEKPQLNFLTNTGLYILEDAIFDFIEDNEFIHITDVIERCIRKGEKVGVYSICEENWMDMGQFDSLEKMQERINGFKSGYWK